VTRETSKLVCLNFQLLSRGASMRVLLADHRILVIGPFVFSFSVTLVFSLANAVVLKVVDIDPQGSIGPSKGLIDSHGVEWRSLNGQGVNE